ncbi:MAG: AAA family ATPase [Erysipelotrichaceae bacterium]|nr:AAA family ATPase [Erysipelotrichaceae bacterium]
MKDRSDEKNRLWNEVLGKKRAYEKDDESSDIELTMDGSTYRGVPNDRSILKDANSALNELMGILNRQQSDLQKMSEEITKTEPVNVDMMKDLDSLQESLKQDYDVEEKIDVKDIDLPKAFMEIEEIMNQNIIGQKMAVSSLSTAVRRPFVMGFDENKAANVILICGGEGTGRHEAVSMIAKECAKRHILSSDQVYTVDMSRYTSGSQEQVFLQDMYQVLYGEGQMICFEGFESSFAGFNRMISELVTKGRIILNRRYVLSQGILVENQTGLVKNAVDALHAQKKYLVFITDGKASAVQNTFGADFMYHVLDTITFEKLSSESIDQIIELEMQQFIAKCSENLHINVTGTDDVKVWVKDRFDKTQGRDGIHAIFYDFYVSASAAVLKAMPENNAAVQVSVKDGVPVISLCDTPLSRSRNSAEEIEAVNRELDGIVGLDEVKGYIRSLQSHIAMNEKRKQQGLKSASVSMHMIFTGNPGTGKTTIARLISRYMKAIGALSTGQLVEVTRADLVAQYVGQTAPLTMNVIRSALGGVLFIDEAYSLYRGKDDSFGLEAIDTLVKAMEDNRENLIVILAGYKKEMAGFLEANSGLKSRFPNVINFKDYTGEELVRIADIQASSKGYVIEEEAKEALRAFFDRRQAENSAEAGNGRLARNTIEEAILHQSSRIVNEENPDMSLLKKEDFDLS